MVSNPPAFFDSKLYNRKQYFQIPALVDLFMVKKKNEIFEDRSIGIDLFFEEILSRAIDTRFAVAHKKQESVPTKSMRRWRNVQGNCQRDSNRV